MSKRYTQKQAARRAARERLAKERRRRRQLWVSVGVVVLLAAAGLISWAVYASQRPSNVAKPTHANPDGGGLVVGSGPVAVDLYLDYQCPLCKELEEAIQQDLTTYVNDHKITLTYHTLGILDFQSPNQYSTRAAAAAGCASDSEKIMEYTKALFDNQVAEGTAGPTDKDLITFGRSVGLDNDFAKCVTEKRYWSWVKLVNEKAGDRGITSTPHLYVNGKELNGQDKSQAGLKAAVDAASQ